MTVYVVIMHYYLTFFRVHNCILTSEKSDKCVIYLGFLILRYLLYNNTKTFVPQRQECVFVVVEQVQCTQH